MSSVSLVDSIFGTSTSADPPSSSAAALLFETKIEIPQRVVQEGPADRGGSSHEEGTAARNKRRPHDQQTETTHPSTGEDVKKQRKKPRHNAAKSVDTEKDDSANITTASTTAATTTTTAADDDNDSNDQPVDLVENRTVFVGNLPSHYNRKLLRQLFLECGPMESTRIRSVATTGVKLPPSQAGNQAMVQKVCANTGRRADDSVKPCVSGYVVFQSVTSVPAALAKNATTLVEGRHLRVDRAVPTHDPARTVFVGNLPYSADEESLAEHFVQILKAHNCDHTDTDNDATTPLIENVRIVRDPTTQQCKGFAYVLLRDAATAAAARQYGNEAVYRKRPLRVQVCGKRCKNQRGATTVPKGTVRRQNAATASPTARNALQRVLAKKVVSTTNKRKRAQKTSGNKSSQATGTGQSKRAAAQAKSSQRAKKMEQRLTQGMGKTRRKQS